MNGKGSLEEAWILYCMHSASCANPWWILILSLLLLAIAATVSGGWLFLGKRRVGTAGALQRKRASIKLPPGSWWLPSLQGVVETLQFAFCNSCPIGTPPPFLASRLRKYGSVFRTQLVGCPTVVSMDPELNKLLLSNEEKLVRVSLRLIKEIIVGPMLRSHGPRHRRFRELATSLVGPAAIQSRHLIPVQQRMCSVLRTWRGMPTIDAEQESRKMLFSYIASILVSLQPEDPSTELLMRDYLLLMSGYSAIPVDLPGTPYNKVLKARRRIFSTLKRIIQDRQQRRTASAAVEANDFLDVLLSEKDECGKHYSEDDVVGFIVFFILGGFETSSVLLTNVMKYLSENQHVADELRREHLRIRENKSADEMLSWDDVQQMHFTKLVLKETLRIATIAHFVMREALQDIVFKDMVIPKGWLILINFSMVHLNPTYYKNPLKFDPWRWKDTTNNNEALLMPFGGGIRTCLGSFLAKFEVSIFLHYLMTTYKWERIMEGDGQLDVVSSLSFPTMSKGLLIKIKTLQMNLEEKRTTCKILSS